MDMGLATNPSLSHEEFIGMVWTLTSVIRRGVFSCGGLEDVLKPRSACPGELLENRVLQRPADIYCGNVITATPKARKVRFSPESCAEAGGCSPVVGSTYSSMPLAAPGRLISKSRFRSLTRRSLCFPSLVIKPWT